jgi:ATP-binding cassette subfamily B protein
MNMNTQNIKAPPSKNSNNIVSFFKTIFRNEFKASPVLLLLLLLGITLGILYECIVPLVFQWLFNDVLLQNDIKLLPFVAEVLMLCFIVLVGSCLLQAVAISKLGTNLVSDLRIQVFEKMQNSQLESKSDNYESELITRFDSDLAFIENVIVFFMWQAARYVMMCLFGGILLVYFDWRMSLLVALIIPLVFILPKFFAETTNDQLQLKQQAEADLLADLQEGINLQDVIRQMQLNDFKKQGFKVKLLNTLKLSYQYNINASLTSSTTILGLNFTRLSILFVGSYLVISNKISPGQLIAFIMLLGTVNSSISSLMNLFPHLNRGAVCFNNIQQLLTKGNIQTSMGTQSIPPLHNSILFKNVSANYGDQQVLSKLNFEIKAGEFIAIVGSSGAGKSTLLKVLLQELPIQKGSILLDKVDLKLISSKSLLDQVGLVRQQPKLFKTTIAENIRMGKLNATMEEIISAAKLAEIHEDIMSFPEKYQTIIGKNNFGLSGGQCQRITIARTLISVPGILFLDEISSALDPIQGALIDETFVKIAGDHTIIMVTHRLSSAVHANKIFVLDKGSVVESGTHYELLSKDGLYKKLWEKQHGFILSPDAKEVAVIPGWLRHVSLFASLPDYVLDEISSEFLIQNCNGDQILFKEGEPGQLFYILVSGEVEVTKIDEQEQEQTVVKLTDGDFFGEIAILYDRPRTASVKTLTDCIFLTLHYKQFRKIFEKLPKAVQIQLLSKGSEINSTN